MIAAAENGTSARPVGSSRSHSIETHKIHHHSHSGWKGGRSDPGAFSENGSRGATQSLSGCVAQIAFCGYPPPV